MKFRQLALIPAITLLGGNALADVTLYGQIGAGVSGFAYDDSDDQSAMTDRARSRVGLQFGTDIDDHLRAIGQFEWNVNALTGGDRGNDVFVRRQTFVGLAHDLGELTLGAHQAAYGFTGGTSWDPMVTTEFEQRRTGGMAGGIYGQNSFVDRTVQYRSPRVAGLQLVLQTGVDTTIEQYPGQRDGNAGDLIGALNFRRGEFEFVAATVKIGRIDREIEDNDDTNTKLGVRWANETWSVAVQHESIGILEGAARAARVDNLRGFGEHAPFTDSHSHLWFGTTYTRGKNMLYLGLAQARSDADDEDLSLVTLAAEHRPIPNFRLYAGVQQARYDENLGRLTDGGDILAENEKLLKFGIGARYDFSANFQ